MNKHMYSDNHNPIDIKLYSPHTRGVKGGQGGNERRLVPSQNSGHDFSSPLPTEEHTRLIGVFVDGMRDIVDDSYRETIVSSADRYLRNVSAYERYRSNRVYEYMVPSVMNDVSWVTVG